MARPKTTKMKQDRSLRSDKRVIIHPQSSEKFILRGIDLSDLPPNCGVIASDTEFLRNQRLNVGPIFIDRTQTSVTFLVNNFSHNRRTIEIGDKLLDMTPFSMPLVKWGQIEEEEVTDET